MTPQVEYKETLKTLYKFEPLKTYRNYNNEYETKTKLKEPYNFINNNVLIGLEIELENCSESFYINRYWTTKSDGSLRNNGIEFVSQPLRTKQIPYAVEYLKEKLYAYNNPDFSERTSIHVHLNVRDFTIERLKVFLLLYCIFEKHFFNVAGTKRENNIFCVPLYKTEQYISLEEFSDGLFNWSKYNALNLGCVLGNGVSKKFGTVEFRHLYGTLDTSILYPWINSIVHLREYSLLVSLEELIETIKTLNTTSEYIALYRKVFKTTCLDLKLISKLDFESCITHTKLNLFHKDNFLMRNNCDYLSTGRYTKKSDVNTLKPNKKYFTASNINIDTLYEHIMHSTTPPLTPNFTQTITGTTF